MNKEKYDAAVKQVLDTFGVEDSDAYKVVIEPDKTTFKVLVHDENIAEVVINSIKERKSGIVTGDIVIHREDDEPKLPSINAKDITGDTDAEKAKSLYDLATEAVSK